MRTQATLTTTRKPGGFIFKRPRRPRRVVPRKLPKKGCPVASHQNLPHHAFTDVHLFFVPGRVLQPQPLTLTLTLLLFLCPFALQLVPRGFRVPRKLR